MTRPPEPEHAPMPGLPPGARCLSLYMTPMEMQRWIEVLYARSEKLEERIAELERKEANVVEHVSAEITKNIRRGYQIQ